MILVIGASGYVGSKICQYLDFQYIPYLPMSYRYGLNDTERLDFLCKTYNITDIINCAAYTGDKSIDDCEHNVKKTEDANVNLVKDIVNIAKKHKIKLLHVSTGCIFDGNDNWTEKDSPFFRESVYTRTKIEAEEIVSKYEESYICRLRLPFDYIDHPKNLLSKLIKFNEISDHENSITNLNDFALIATGMIVYKKPYGIYNIVNHGSITFSDIKTLLAKNDMCPYIWKVLTPNEERIKFPNKKSNTTLNNFKIRQEGFIVDDVKTSISKCLANWNNTESNIFW